MDISQKKIELAKDVLVSWLRDAAKNNNGCFGWLSWQVNRGEPTYAVYKDYPLIKDVLFHQDGYVQAWDEMISEHGSDVPSVFAILKLGYPVAGFIDVAIQEKGAIVYGFEIVDNSNPVQQRQSLLKKLDAEIYVVDASWILRQSSIPENIVYKSVYNK